MICSSCGAYMTSWLHFDCPASKYTIPEAIDLEGQISASYEEGFKEGLEAEEGERIGKFKLTLKKLAVKYIKAKKAAKWLQESNVQLNHEKQRLLFERKQNA